MKTPFSFFLSLLLLAFSSKLQSNETGTKNLTPAIPSSFPYVVISAGPAPWPAPGIGFGYRKTSEKINTLHYDISFRGSTFIAISQAKLSLALLGDIKIRNKELYLGIGASGSYVNDPEACWGKANFFAASPEFRIGKTFVTKKQKVRFAQAEISIPTFATNGKMLKFPLVLFSYGIPI